jgi:hypothetical protein
VAKVTKLTTSDRPQDMEEIRIIVGSLIRENKQLGLESQDNYDELCRLQATKEEIEHRLRIAEQQAAKDRKGEQDAIGDRQRADDAYEDLRKELEEKEIVLAKKSKDLQYEKQKDQDREKYIKQLEAEIDESRQCMIEVLARIGEGIDKDDDASLDALTKEVCTELKNARSEGNAALEQLKVAQEEVFQLQATVTTHEQRIRELGEIPLRTLADDKNFVRPSRVQQGLLEGQKELVEELEESSGKLKAELEEQKETSRAQESLLADQKMAMKEMEAAFRSLKVQFEDEKAAHDTTRISLEEMQSTVKDLEQYTSDQAEKQKKDVFDPIAAQSQLKSPTAERGRRRESLQEYVKEHEEKNLRLESTVPPMNEENRAEDQQLKETIQTLMDELEAANRERDSLRKVVPMAIQAYVARETLNRVQQEQLIVYQRIENMMEGTDPGENHLNLTSNEEEVKEHQRVREMYEETIIFKDRAIDKLNLKLKRQYQEFEAAQEQMNSQLAICSEELAHYRESYELERQNMAADIEALERQRHQRDQGTKRMSQLSRGSRVLGHEPVNGGFHDHLKEATTPQRTGASGSFAYHGSAPPAPPELDERLVVATPKDNTPTRRHQSTNAVAANEFMPGHAQSWGPAWARNNLSVAYGDRGPTIVPQESSHTVQDSDFDTSEENFEQNGRDLMSFANEPRPDPSEPGSVVDRDELHPTRGNTLPSATLRYSDRLGLPTEVALQGTGTPLSFASPARLENTAVTSERERNRLIHTSSGNPAVVSGTRAANSRLESRALPLTRYHDTSEEAREAARVEAKHKMATTNHTGKNPLQTIQEWTNVNCYVSISAAIIIVLVSVRTWGQWKEQQIWYEANGVGSSPLSYGHNWYSVPGWKQLLIALLYGCFGWSFETFRLEPQVAFG